MYCAAYSTAAAGALLGAHASGRGLLGILYGLLGAASAGACAVVLCSIAVLCCCWALHTAFNLKKNRTPQKCQGTKRPKHTPLGGPQHPPYQNAQAPSMPKWLSTIQLPSFVAATMAVWAQISSVWHTTRSKVDQAGQTNPMPQPQLLQLLDGVHGAMISIWGQRVGH